MSVNITVVITRSASTDVREPVQELLYLA